MIDRRTPNRAATLWHPQRFLVALALMGACIDACAPPSTDTQDDGGSKDSIAGTLQVRTQDVRGEGFTRRYSLVTEDGERIGLEFKVDPELRAGTELEIRGSRNDGAAIKVQSFTVRLEPKRLDTPLTRKPINHRVAVLVASQSKVTNSDAQTHMAELSKFYAETTHGIDTFSLALFRRYNVALSANDCMSDNTGNISDALIAQLEKEGFSRQNFEHIATVVPGTCGNDWSGAWGEMGSINNSGALSMGQVTMYKEDSFDPWYLAHELGHNIGFDHAHSASCSGTYVPPFKGCTIDEYGDYNDVMGWGEGVYWSGGRQRFMGWTTPQNVVTAGKSGTFNLVPLDAKYGCSGIQELRIPVPNQPNNYYYLEFRKARTDSTYAGTGSWKGQRGDALLVSHSQDGNTDFGLTTRLNLDATSNYQGAKVGRTYTLGGGVSILLQAMNATSARVVIQTPGSAAHRNDAAGSLAAQSDGSFGPSSCTSGGATDTCPSDPNKTAPGTCGCGVPDVDTDRDGTMDCKDTCPQDPQKTAPGTCGCGVAEGNCGTQSACTQVNEGATATLSCGSGSTVSGVKFASYGTPTGMCGSFATSTCNAATSTSKVQAACLGKTSCSIAATNTVFGDPCAGTLKRLSVQLVCSSVDSCPNDPNKSAPGTCGCGVADVDTDRDGTMDCKDSCPQDPRKTSPGACGCGVAEGSCGGTTCADTVGFVDGQGYVCSDWVGTDCTRALEDWGYTQAQEDAILSKCPRSCNRCPAGG